MRTPWRVAIAWTLAGSLLLAGCTATNHPQQIASMGKAVSDATLEQQLQTPGPVVLETVTSAHHDSTGI